jgi:hypothetical protein
MAALRLLSLILLSGGLATQPVLLQTASCCCAQQTADAGIQAEKSSEAVTIAAGCPNCRAARESSRPSRINNSQDSPATLHPCSCQKQEAPPAVARVQSQADVSFSLTAVEHPFDCSAISASSAFAVPQSHPPGRLIPVRILKCSWLI